jgi:hypothetical protein
MKCFDTINVTILVNGDTSTHKSIIPYTFNTLHLKACIIKDYTICFFKKKINDD